MIGQWWQRRAAAKRARAAVMQASQPNAVDWDAAFQAKRDKMREDGIRHRSEGGGKYAPTKEIRMDARLGDGLCMCEHSAKPELPCICGPVSALLRRQAE